jgi:hypothetical protein
MTENEQNEFDALTKGLEIHLEYKTLEVSENAPEPIQPGRKNRQWALVKDGKIVALGPATGGMKSAFIAFAAENEGHTVAHRWVTSGEWLIPA